MLPAAASLAREDGRATEVSIQSPAESPQQPDVAPTEEARPPATVSDPAEPARDDGTPSLDAGGEDFDVVAAEGELAGSPVAEAGPGVSLPGGADFGGPSGGGSTTADDATNPSAAFQPTTEPTPPALQPDLFADGRQLQELLLTNGGVVTGVADPPPQTDSLLDSDSPWRSEPEVDAPTQIDYGDDTRVASDGTEADPEVAPDTETPTRDDRYGDTPLIFEEGDDGTPFLSRGPGATALLEKDGFTFNFHDADDEVSQAVKLRFLGANEDVEVVGADPLATRVNHYGGGKDREGVRAFGKVLYKGLYDGVDLVVRPATFGKRQWQYDLVLHPGADPDVIKLRLEGSDDVKGHGDGSLRAALANGEFVSRTPVLYQDGDDGTRKNVAGGYRDNGDGTYGFRIDGDYDRDRPIVLDPTVSYSRYVAGTGTEWASAVAVTAGGQATVVGKTVSGSFLARFNAAGDGLAYVTYLEGSDARDVALSRTAATPSWGQSTTVGYLEGQDSVTAQTAISLVGTGGVGDAVVGGAGFVKRFDNGGALQQTASLGSGVANAVAVDDAGKVVVAGDQGGDGFVKVFEPNLTGTPLSAAVGGSGTDTIADVVVDASGVYVAGSTTSADLPDVLGDTLAGGTDGVVVKLAAADLSLVATRYFGGSGDDRINALAGGSDLLTVTGATASTDLPGLTTLPGGFVAALDTGDGDLLWCSRLPGGAGGVGAVGNDVVVDGSGTAYVVGTRTTTDDTDALVAAFDPAGGLGWAETLGGAGADFGHGVARDAAGELYVVGATRSADFRTQDTTGYEMAGNLLAGESDGFLGKLLLGATPEPVVKVVAVDEFGAESPSDSLRYRLTRSYDTASPLTVTLSFGGTATLGLGEGEGDFSGHGGLALVGPGLAEATFGVGESEVEFTLTPRDDSAAEADETVTLTLVGGAGYAVGGSAATGLVYDDDTPASVWVEAGTPGAEPDGSNPATPLTFTVRRSGRWSQALTVGLAYGGTSAGADFASRPTGVTIAAHAGSATVTLTPTADGLVEGTETARLVLQTGTGYTPTGTPATGTITDADVPSGTTVVTVGETAPTASEAGDDPGAVTFFRTGDTSGPLTVGFATGGDAGAGDYALSGSGLGLGEVTFGVGQSSVTVEVDATDDGLYESDETLTLTAQTGANYSLGSSSSGTVTLLDDDAEVSIAATTATTAEGSGTPAAFTFSRLGNLTSALVVRFEVSGGASATDYSPTLSGTYTLSPGTASGTLSIAAVDDALGEAAETLTLKILPDDAYQVGTADTATVTIADDDDHGTDNAPPDARDDAVTTPVETPIYVTVLTNDADADDDPLTITQIAQGQHGVVTVEAVGVLRYTPAEGWSGTDHFTYRVGDGRGGSDEAVVTVTVPPTGTPDVPGDQLDQAPTVALAAGQTMTRRERIGDGLYGNRDVDLYRVELAEGQTLTVGLETDGPGWVSELDARIRLFDSGGVELASFAVPGSGGRLVYAPSFAGTYYLGVSGRPNDGYDALTAASGRAGSTGEYRLSLGLDTVTVVTVEADPAAAVEGGPDGGFTFRRAGPLGQPLTAYYNRSGSASSIDFNVSDYTGSVTFAAGSATATLALDAADDGLAEGDEAVVLTLSDHEGYTTGPADRGDAWSTTTANVVNRFFGGAADLGYSTTLGNLGGLTGYAVGRLSGWDERSTARAMMLGELAGGLKGAYWQGRSLWRQENGASRHLGGLVGGRSYAGLKMAAYEATAAAVGFGGATRSAASTAGCRGRTTRGWPRASRCRAALVCARR